MTITTKTEKETLNFAKKFASKLKGGEVIGLIGDLGAGKTIFTKGLAKGLGINDNITSPTFVLMKIYNIKQKNIKKLVHVDAYRLKTPKDMLAIGIDEYFNRDDTIIAVEWADKIKDILPLKKLISININYLDNGMRKINVGTKYSLRKS